MNEQVYYLWTKTVEPFYALMKIVPCHTPLPLFAVRAYANIIASYKTNDD